MQITKTVYKGGNGESEKDLELSLDAIDAPSYEEIVGEIEAKIGKMPDLPADLPKGNWTKQARKVLSERYLQKDKEGKIVETPEEMVWRVSWEIASAEARWGKTKEEVLNIAKDFYNLLIKRRFLPNSPTLMNAGTGNRLQYSACFVLPVEDSMEGIFDALKWQALIHKSGGGTGFAFSRLRPRGSVVRTSSGTASGPVSFMRVFDAATNEVKQGGKRRGANMGILRVDHPDIMEFIHCKEEDGITNFNISVGITDEFMRAYQKGDDYDLVDPKSGKVVGSLNAKEVFDEIAKGAWKTGDPGVIFLDRINQSTANPIPNLGPIESTNPCGEQPLYPFDACNLGSIFLPRFIKEEEGRKVVDWEGLKKTTRMATRFLDNVIEVNPYPLKEIRQTVFGSRRIGLGVGGWADMLIELGVPYDSKEALDLGEKVMGVIQEEAVKTSQKLAHMRGPFPLWPISIYKDEEPRRNSTVTTIAPTGTISIIAGASSGIEPLFAVSYRHIVKDRHLNRTLIFVNPKFKKVAKEKGFWSKQLKEKVTESGLVRNIDEIPEDVKAVFGTAHDIHHNWHIKMQSVFQKHTENAVSKTINLRHEVGEDEIKEAYLLAWRTNCKGVTVFRDGSKDIQVLNHGTKGKDQKKVAEPKAERPYVVKGATYRVNTPVGTAFVTINERKDGEPLEVFINVGKAGSDVTAMAEALGRTISTALRFRGSLSPKERAKEVASQLAGIGGRRSVGFGPNKILSLPDAVAMALSNHFNFKTNGNGSNKAEKVKSGQKKEKSKRNGEVEAKSDLAGAVMVAAHPSHEGNHDPTVASAESDVSSTPKQAFAQQGVHADICPSCGASALVYEEGCVKCHACGHSEC